MDCNRADFVGDVTIPDNTILQLSQPFTKTWRIRNTGSCTWTTGYQLVFMDGDRLGSPASVPLPFNVAPSQTVDVSVDMVAPDAVGHYEGVWGLRSADGKTFGVGSLGADHIWVRIRAIAPAFSAATGTPGLPSETMTVTPAPT